MTSANQTPLHSRRIALMAAIIKVVNSASVQTFIKVNLGLAKAFSAKPDLFKAQKVDVRHMFAAVFFELCDPERYQAMLQSYGKQPTFLQGCGLELIQSTSLATLFQINPENKTIQFQPGCIELSGEDHYIESEQELQLLATVVVTQFENLRFFPQ